MGSSSTVTGASGAVREAPRVDAVVAIIDGHARAMFRVAVAVVRDAALAEDVVQEATIKAWNNVESFRGDGSFGGWVLRITHNTAVSMLRSMREEAWDPAWIPARTVPSAERRVIAAVELDAALAAFARMDSLSRTIMALREGEGLAYEEIAETLGITVGQVKIRLFRARRALAAAAERGEA